MALELIGAGFGRTGTESMKLALEQLGLGPCHHMKEVLADPEQRTRWRAVAHGEAVDWDEVLAGYRSAVDWPSAFFWRELSAHYPEAKILLTVRDSADWYRSFSNTILAVISGSRLSPDELGPKLIGDRVFGGRGADRDHAIAVYERNIADVQAAFPPERLLTFRVGDGWAPLCQFLGVPIPSTPFPRTNSTADFHTTFSRRSRIGSAEHDPN